MLLYIKEKQTGVVCELAFITEAKQLIFNLTKGKINDVFESIENFDLTYVDYNHCTYSTCIDHPDQESLLKEKMGNNLICTNSAITVC